MITHGRVENGVIVLDSGVHLAEGQEVTVLTVNKRKVSRSQSVLDIATVEMGSVLRPLTSGDDLLGEMLEGHP